MKPLDPVLLQVLAGRRPTCRPVWLMRQAGRFLPEYRELRERKSFAELLRDPELASDVTLMPLRRFDLDAAILFTDLLVLLEAMGIPLAYTPGPELGWTVESAADLERLRPIDTERDLAVPLATAARVRAELASDKALIGFVGAPFTLGCYLVEGKGSKTWNKLRALAWGDPELYLAVMDLLAGAALDFGLAQHRAGCDAIQVFDSWAGVAEPGMFRRLVLPALEKLVLGLKRAGCPVIYFLNGAAPQLETMVETGADCLGIDWRLDIARAHASLPEGLPLQGNLDPTVLLGAPAMIESEARRILRAAGDRPHVFNLGHGLDPGTPLEAVQKLIDTIRAWDGGSPA
ncbi:MAG: uroporphyrinogen decarboxylase [Planctomycetota bacterium]